MRKSIIVTIIVIMNVVTVNSQIKTTESDYLDLAKTVIEKNSDLFKIDTIDNEQILILKGNTYNQEIDEFTGKNKEFYP